MKPARGDIARGEPGSAIPRGSLQVAPVSVRIKLSSLWVSVMFCFIYADYFELYVPGKLQEMLNGKMALGEVTQAMLVGTATMMIVPSLMIFCSVALRAAASRILNVVVGTVYAAIMLVILSEGPWAYYALFAAVELVLLCGVVWIAWRWPRTPGCADASGPR